MTEQKSGTVLLVEDNPGDRVLLTNMLTFDVPRPFEVRETSTFADALEALANSAFSVALVDLSLPDSCGLETVERLVTAHPDLPLIVLTGNQDEALALKAIKAGAQDYLLKGRVDGNSLNRSILHSMERKSIEQELKDAKETAERALAENANYLAFLGHEIRTPLNAVIGFSRLLNRVGLDEEGQHYNRQIGRTADILLALINDMLDFSKLEAGELALHHQPYSLSDTINDCLELLDAQAREKDLALTSVMDASLPTKILGDGHRLRQVLINLISNAVKFTRDGSVHVECYSNHNKRLVIAVIDSGVGIAEDKQEQIFRPYQQASGAVAAQNGGTGLGLAITKRLVEMMGGEIKLESQPGEGSRFSVTMPLEPASDEALSCTCKGHGSLILSPRDAHRSALARQLESLGCSVVTASTATEAISLIDQAKAAGAPPANIFVDPRINDISASDLSTQIDFLLAEHPHQLVLLDHSGSVPLGYTSALAFPLRLSDLLKALHPATQMLRKPVETRDRNLHVLAVDDNAANRLLCKAMLENSGHRVDTAGSGNEALERLALHGPYDAVLMDMHMPEMDGATAARALLAMAPGLPMIALTGDDTLSPEQSAPFTHIYTKPVDWAGLLDTLKTLPKPAN